MTAITRAGKRVMLLSLMFCFGQANATVKPAVFVSFSMPESLLEQTLSESVKCGMPAYLSGLYHDSMPETLNRIMALAKRIPGLDMQIDPTRFERFGIRQVPALVVENDRVFDVIYGNLTLRQGLERIHERGESDLMPADIRRMCGE
ncbi:type-F conjugative transfer system pilin assembly protein TrbC [Legionella geestiana]|uniref:type-F conjugative transfer system pilin assembly protein TrbC n=1 Tax=Legionella geestiana TaxID=45065 RepID=UPI001FE9EA39|nr:type-F conjugative transfer system pilin assembly protein TrbC [Legionella geestiana]